MATEAAPSRVQVDLPEYAVGLLDRPERYLCVYGGRGGTKSWSAAINIVIKCATVPGYRVAVVREFKATLNDGAIALIYDLAQRLGVPCRKPPQHPRVDFPGTGAEVIAVGAERNPDNLRGLELIDLAWLEEATGISGSSFEVLEPSVRKETSKILMTFNPRFATDAVYQMFVEPSEPPPRSWRHMVNYGDHPQFQTDALDAARERMRASGNPNYRHVWHGELIRMVGAVFDATKVYPSPDWTGADVRRVRAWDLAGTKDGGDYTVGVLMAVRGRAFRIEDVIRGQWDSAEVEERVTAATHNDSTLTSVVIERGPGDAGLRDARSWAARLAGYSFTSNRPTGSKAERARPFAAAVNSGLVSRPVVADWWGEFAGELAAFSEDQRAMRGRYDDQVDAAAAAFNFLGGDGAPAYCSVDRGSAWGEDPLEMGGRWAKMR